MKKRCEQVYDAGSGVIRLKSASAQADWEFHGLQQIIETTFLNGKTERTKGIMEYGKYIIWFHEVPAEDDLPKVGVTTSLMIDDKKIGGDATWWVITYLAENGKVGVELCNRPSG